MNQTEAIKKAEDRLNLCIHISECSENKGRDKRRSTMSEIERAIEYFERKIVKNDRARENYVALFAEEAKRQWIEIDRPIGELALKLLRAELEREKNPLTCDGCRWEQDYSPSQCDTCSRSGQYDRYEPKGEPNV